MSNNIQSPESYYIFGNYLSKLLEERIYEYIQPRAPANFKSIPIDINKLNKLSEDCVVLHGIANSKLTF